MTLDKGERKREAIYAESVRRDWERRWRANRAL